MLPLCFVHIGKRKRNSQDRICGGGSWLSDPPPEIPSTMKSRSILKKIFMLTTILTRPENNSIYGPGNNTHPHYSTIKTDTLNARMG